MNLGFTEMLFIFLLALLIFGPKKLPHLGRQLGRGLAEFRRASNEFKSQLEDEIRQLELQETVGHTVAPPPQPEGAVSRGTTDPGPGDAEASSTTGGEQQAAAPGDDAWKASAADGEQPGGDAKPNA